MSLPIGSDLAGYYRLHAPIYDLTRPLFLFGRQRLLGDVAGISASIGQRQPRILEIGCGTGSNLAILCRRFPDSQLVGVDLAAAMIERAQRRRLQHVHLVHGALGRVDLGAPFDIVIASYMLSMTGDEQARCIAAARAVLAPGGLLAVVDFHSTRSQHFARWMAHNHVRFNTDLPMQLQATAAPMAFASRIAYAGAWRYFSWIGY